MQSTLDYTALYRRKARNPRQLCKTNPLNFHGSWDFLFFYGAKNRYYQETDKMDFLPEVDVNYFEYPDRISNMPTTMINRILDLK